MNINIREIALHSRRLKMASNLITEAINQLHKFEQEEGIELAEGDDPIKALRKIRGQIQANRELYAEFIDNMFGDAE